MRNLLLISFLIFVLQINAQSKKEQPKIYDPKADAKKEIKDAIAKADSMSKHVLIQIGGNWCPWCLKLHKFFEEDEVIDSILKAEYILVKVNYSKENNNQDILSQLEFPQRFGFPVLVVLDGNGRRIHTQDTGLLESGEGYDHKKIVSFLNNWKYHALRPENYLKN